MYTSFKVIYKDVLTVRWMPEQKLLFKTFL